MRKQTICKFSFILSFLWCVQLALCVPSTTVKVSRKKLDHMLIYVHSGSVMTFLENGHFRTLFYMRQIK